MVRLGMILRLMSLFKCFLRQFFLDMFFNPRNPLSIVVFHIFSCKAVYVKAKHRKESNVRGHACRIARFECRSDRNSRILGNVSNPHFRSNHQTVGGWIQKQKFLHRDHLGCRGCCTGRR